MLREARDKLFALRAETRRAADPAIRDEYEAICRARDEKLRTFDAEMNRQIFSVGQAAPRALTNEEQHEIEMMGVGGADGTGFQNSNQVLDAAVVVQADTLQSLKRTEQLQNATEETGMTTLQTIQRQTEQMYHVDEELQNLQGLIDRASRDVQWFYRQLAGDKCFLVIFALLILTLIALTFIAVWTKRK